MILRVWRDGGNGTLIEFSLFHSEKQSGPSQENTMSYKKALQSRAKIEKDQVSLLRLPVRSYHSIKLLSLRSKIITSLTT